MAPIIFIAACLATKALDKNKKNAPNKMLGFTNLCEAPGSKALVLAALGEELVFLRAPLSSRALGNGGGGKYE